MPSKGIGIKIHTAQGQVKLYFTTAGSAPALQRELGCHRINVKDGRVITRQGDQLVTAADAALEVTEYGDNEYGAVGEAAQRAVAQAINAVADRLWQLVALTPAQPGRPRPVIVNCHAGRHRSPACVVAFIKKYGVKPAGGGYSVAEAQALVADAFARKAAKEEAKRAPHATTPQPYFARTVGDFQRFGF